MSDRSADSLRRILEWVNDPKHVELSAPSIYDLYDLESDRLIDRWLRPASPARWELTSAGSYELNRLRASMPDWKPQPWPRAL